MQINGFIVFFRPPNPIEYLAAYLLKNKNQFEWCGDLGGPRWGVGEFSLCELVTVIMQSSVICVSTVSFYVNLINLLTYHKTDVGIIFLKNQK